MVEKKKDGEYSVHTLEGRQQEFCSIPTLIKMNDLPVYERFHSWQGEGFHLGNPAFFIRLHGCRCIAHGAILRTWHGIIKQY